MSGFPPPLNQGFPPPGAGQFPPPQGAGGAGSFPPPPNRMNPPPPAAGFAPPPGGANQLNNAMGNMSLQGNHPPQGGAPFAPPPPAGGAAPIAPTMFTPAAPQPGSGAPMQRMMPPAQFGQQQPPPPQQQFGQQQPPPPQQQFGQHQPPPPQQQPVGSNFYATPLSAQQMHFAPAPPGPGTSAAPGGMPVAPFQENVDFSIQVPERLFRLTAKKIPQTTGMMTASRVPIGAVLRPLAPCGEDDEEVETVQPGNAGIIRCKRCRTYINAFVTWLENGRRWRCNICAQLNDCPSTYFCHLDEQGLRRDRAQRPELAKGVVEFIAPTEYMVRPPQEPSYFFVIDVSATAVRSGMLHSAASAIRQSLDDLPGRGRTKIGFITYDNSVHYYNLAPDLSSPQMMVVSDLKELFVPLPDNLLVNLKESRGVVEAFLDNLPEMFAKNPIVSQSCLGPALKAAFTVMKAIGGKMCVFQSIQPNLGDGSLKPRENHAIMGTPNEVNLLRPDVAWYKETAIEFSRQQICVDMFLFPYQYMDLAALGELPRYTSGQIYSYVSFNPETDGPRFQAELNKSLTQMTAFEAVMRIRCTKGMRITNFYGNFYIRGTDLLALPNCNTDSVFGFDLAHDEANMPSSVVTVQAALLYTSSDGERRIRVMTQAIPITSLTSELIASVDTEVVCNLLTKQAVEVINKTTLDNARMKMQQTCVEMLRAAKEGDRRSVSGYAVPPGQHGQNGGDEKDIPENLKLLPLYTLAMMKNVAFRGGTDVHPDERVQAHHLLTNMWVDKSRHFIYPHMYSIHDMEDAAGHPCEGDPDESENDRFAGRERILMPESVNLSVERLATDGIFLLDNGIDMNLWVGRSADPILLEALFGTNSLENVDMSHVKLDTSGDEFAIRLGRIMQALREDDADPFVIPPKVNIIREGDARMEARFFWYLIEDRASFQGGTYSYLEFMQFVNSPGGPAPSGAPPPVGPGGMGMRGPPGPPGPPQQHGYGAPPPPGPPGPPQQHGYGAPPPPGPPGPPQQQVYGAPPPPGPPGPPQQQVYGAPPPPQPPTVYGAPPPQRGMPLSPTAVPPPYGSQPPGPPQHHAPPPAGPPSYGSQPPGPPQQYAPPPAGPPSYGSHPQGPPQRHAPPPAGPPSYGSQPPGPPQHHAPPSAGPPSYGSQPPPARGPPQGPPSSGGYPVPPPPARGAMPPPPPGQRQY